MGDKSTPISSLNNNLDESEIANRQIQQFNANLGGGFQQSTPLNQLQQSADIPPLNPQITQMEQKFENRNLNQEIYGLNTSDITSAEHRRREMNRLRNQQMEDDDEDEDEDDEELYEEFEQEDVPLWKKIINEVRIPLIVFLLAVIFFNCSFDKMMLRSIPMFGDQYNQCNNYGFLVKAFLVAVLSYVLILFIKF